MSRIKRKQNDPVHDVHINKKRKLQDQTTTIDPNKSSITRFEVLSNELIYEIFEYLDIYYVYQSFFNLNKRFQYFLVNSTLPIKINISTISKSSFEHYYNDIILPNKHRINILRLSNPFTVDIIFSPPRFILKFLQLETLILDNIKTKYLENIFIHLISLPKLYSLTIHPVDYVRNSTYFYLQIFRLPYLKFCQITYETKNNNQSSLIISAERSSPIEHLIINGQFSIDCFGNLLSYVPQLRRLSINSLIETHCKKIDLSPIILKDFECVSLIIDVTCFDQLEILIKYFFQHIQVLRISIKYYKAFLDAKRWEELILTSMPNLKIFDIYFDGTVIMSYTHNPLTFDQLIDQFNSPFWIQRKWFFTHQYTYEGTSNVGIFYSINPYRRKEFPFYSQSDKHLCSYGQKTNLNSVKHVNIRSKQVTKNFLNYFPNAIELTIGFYFNLSNDSMSMVLNPIISLTKLKKLVIQSYSFPFEELIKLLYYTPNLHILNIESKPIYQTNLMLIQQSDIFQYVSKINQIKNFDFKENCTLEHMKMIMDLFPRLTTLKTGFNKKEIRQITEFIFPKMNNKTYNLIFLTISYTPKIDLKRLEMSIKLEKLLNDYFIHLVDYNLYLWL